MLLVLPAVGCGGSQETTGNVDAEAAATLARRADAVAARLAGGDPCGARRAALELAAAAGQAIRGDRVADGAAAELRGRTTSLAAAISCVPPVPVEQEGGGDDDDDDDEDGGEGKGKSKGKSKGEGKADGGRGKERD